MLTLHLLDGREYDFSQSLLYNNTKINKKANFLTLFDIKLNIFEHFLPFCLIFPYSGVDLQSLSSLGIVYYKDKGGVCMHSLPNCPQCNSEYTYENGNLLVCPECAHEWVLGAEEAGDEGIKDANGNILSDGDDVIVLKDLRVKGSSSAVKKGTKVRNIRLVQNPGDGHDIDCRIDGFGAMKLKSEFVKKA